LRNLGSQGRMIEFDSTGIRGSGDLEARSLSACSASTFNGNYVFGLSGQQAQTSDSVAGPLAIVGTFVATPPASGSSGSIASSEFDANTPTKITTLSKTLSGTYAASAETTRCTMSFSSSLPNMNFAVYPVTNRFSFVIETDTIGPTTPILSSGTMETQLGAPFSTASGSAFFNQNYVARLTGSYYNGSAFVPDVALYSFTGSSGSAFTYSATENRGGSVITTPATGSNFIQADQFGRIATNASAVFQPVFYIGGADTYVLGEVTANGKPDPFFGTLETQDTGPLNATIIASAATYLVATAAPSGPAVPDSVGYSLLTDTDATTGTIVGLQSLTTSASEVASQVVQGTYTVPSTSTTSGFGSLSLTLPATTPPFTGSFVILSPGEIWMISTTTGDPNPAIFILQQ